MIFGWMTDSHPTFRETVVNTFYDLTDIVKGDISERWPLLAGRPTASWGQSVWSTDPSDPETARVFGIPGTFAGGPGNAMFARTDLLEAAGLAMPTTVEEAPRGRPRSERRRRRQLGLRRPRLPHPGLVRPRRRRRLGLHRRQARPQLRAPRVHRVARVPPHLLGREAHPPGPPSGTLDGQALHKAGTIVFQLDGISWWSGVHRPVHAEGTGGHDRPARRDRREGPQAPLHVGTSRSTAGPSSTRTSPRSRSRSSSTSATSAPRRSAPRSTSSSSTASRARTSTYGADGFPVHTEVGTTVVQAPVNHKEIPARCSSSSPATRTSSRPASSTTPPEGVRRGRHLRGHAHRGPGGVQVRRPRCSSTSRTTSRTAGPTSPRSLTWSRPT